MRLRLELDRRGFWLGSSRGSEERSFLAAGSGVSAGSLAFAGLLAMLAEIQQVQLDALQPECKKEARGRPLLRAYRNVRVVIRLSLGGCTNRPFYRIVAAHNRRARDGKYLEQIGCYDPLPNRYGEKIVGINFDRFKHWFAYGATLSKPAEKLLGLSGFFPLHPMTITNAERLRKKKAREAEKAAEKGEEEEEGDLEEKQEHQQN